MNKFLLFIILINLHICSSQELNPSIKKSNAFREPYSKSELVKSFQDGKGGYFTVRHYDEYVRSTQNHKTSEGFIVQHWDNEQKSLSYTNYKIETNKRGKVSGMFLNQGKLHVIEYINNKRNRTVDCFVHISQSSTAGFERKKIFSFKVEKLPKVPNGSMSTSPNGNYHVFHIDSYLKNQEKHKLLVFNNRLELIWDKEFTHIEEDELFDLKEVEIDDKGDVYALGKVFLEGRKRQKQGRVNYHFELFKVTSESTETSILSTAENFINAFELVLNKDRINCIGLFSKEKDGPLIGTTFFSVDKSSMEVTENNIQNFSSKFMDDKYADLGNRGFTNCYIRSIEPLKDQGYIITAEEIDRVVFYSAYGPPSVSSYYNDIIVLRLSKSGKIVWDRNINKKQSCLINAYSFTSVSNDENTCLFFNAYKKMEDLTGGRKRFNSGILGKITKGNSNLYALKFDENGKFNTSTIQQNGDSKVVFNVKNGAKIGDSRIVVFGSDENINQFLTIGLE